MSFSAAEVDDDSLSPSLKFIFNISELVIGIIRSSRKFSTSFTGIREFVADWFSRTYWPSFVTNVGQVFNICFSHSCTVTYDRDFSKLCREGVWSTDVLSYLLTPVRKPQYFLSSPFICSIIQPLDLCDLRLIVICWNSSWAVRISIVLLIVNSATLLSWRHFHVIIVIIIFS